MVLKFSLCYRHLGWISIPARLSPYQHFPLSVWKPRVTMETQLQGNRTSCQKAGNTGRKMARQKPKRLRECHTVHLHKANIFNKPHLGGTSYMRIRILVIWRSLGQNWFLKAYVERVCAVWFWASSFFSFIVLFLSPFFSFFRSKIQRHFQEVSKTFLVELEDNKPFIAVARWN